ncbi:hypothetical protein M5K25_000604 [Dendrobium thyrsiflorum]|uniref:Uncharacterized protein n=1 Tax=Dendrobium thyrsiflorum TaxID=117978 RepID=A0ABD0VUC6_DENTH
MMLMDPQRRQNFGLNVGYTILYRRLSNSAIFKKKNSAFQIQQEKTSWHSTLQTPSHCSLKTIIVELHLNSIVTSVVLSAFIKALKVYLYDLNPIVVNVGFILTLVHLLGYWLIRLEERIKEKDGSSIEEDGLSMGGGEGYVSLEESRITCHGLLYHWIGLGLEGNLILSDVGLPEKRIYHAALNGNGLPRLGELIVNIVASNMSHTYSDNFSYNKLLFDFNTNIV